MLTTMELPIQSYDCIQTPIGVLHAEEKDDLFSLYVFRVEFPAPL